MTSVNDLLMSDIIVRGVDTSIPPNGMHLETRMFLA